MPKLTREADLHDMFIIKLRSLYDVEQRLLKALPKMAKKSSSRELRMGLEEHLKETKGHIRRLEQAFRSLDLKPQKTKVEAIRGLVADAEWMMKNTPKGPAIDAAIIASGQYVEHYEMAGYGTAREWARVMGHRDAEELLAQTLAEEEVADEKLNALATGGINEAANTSRD